MEVPYPQLLRAPFAAFSRVFSGLVCEYEAQQRFLIRGISWPLGRHLPPMRTARAHRHCARSCRRTVSLASTDDGSDGPGARVTWRL